MPPRKIPTKAELIQLQRLYKTDEKIAERLGGVTPQLVAYWRRKKNIPKHSFAKFSEIEIREVWERFGDDYRCGLELGIAKAAFYNWRRKYGLREKPAFLKLEQLELNLGLSGRSGGRRQNYGRQTISQKILAERSGIERLETGQEIEIEPDWVISQSDSATIIEKFREMGHNFIWNSARIAIAVGQILPYESMAERQKIIREFTKRQNIKNFYDIRDGACHQILVEKGLILPGQVVFGTEQSISAYGGIDALSYHLGIAEMAQLWASGKIKTTVPETARIMINGKLPKSISARDIILHIKKNLNSEQIKNRVIEFHGAVVSQMTVAERFALTHQASELGALSALCPFDSTTRRYFMGRSRMPFRPAFPDRDAVYADSIEYAIDHLPPQIISPNDGGTVVPVTELAGLNIEQVILGSCANGHFEDLRIAADILKGKKVHPDVRMFIYPGSRAIYLEALKKGLIRAFIESGAIVMNPGCGPCHDAHKYWLASGERCLSTAARNCDMGDHSKSGEIYFASPATAAATAVRGAIADPSEFLK
jgi:3-isopropylmalate/(R)-2-methylmalate dehydratase large subunit